MIHLSLTHLSDAPLFAMDFIFIHFYNHNSSIVSIIDTAHTTARPMIYLRLKDWSDAPLFSFNYIRGPEIALLPRVCKRYRAASSKAVADFLLQNPVVYAGTAEQENGRHNFQMIVYEHLNRLVLEIRYQSAAYAGCFIRQRFQLDTLPKNIAEMFSVVKTLHLKGNHSMVFRSKTQDNVFFDTTGMVVADKTVTYIANHYLQIASIIPEKKTFTGWGCKSPESIVNSLHALLVKDE